VKNAKVAGAPPKKEDYPASQKKKNNFSLEISRKIKLQWKPT